MYSILEIDYSVSPGGVNMFEVYDKPEDEIDDVPLYSSPSLSNAVQYCYSLGHNFIVYTLAEYYRLWDNDMKDIQPTLPLEF